MFKRRETLAYVAAILAVLAFLLAWKFFIARDELSASANYQTRLANTRVNVFGSDGNKPAESLKLYAVDIISGRPSAFAGYGVYLGKGFVLTAAREVPAAFYSGRPRVLIAGEDLTAKVIKRGDPERADLALLAIDETRLPISVRLRQNPLCRVAVQIGTNVVLVDPERSSHTQLISPSIIAPQLRSKFNTLVTQPAGPGSGVFESERKCLLGVVSHNIVRYGYKKQGPFELVRPVGSVAYFIPVPAIVQFMSSKQ